MSFELVISEVVRVTLPRDLGRGSGCARGLSVAKLWHRETSFEGDVERDWAVDQQPLSAAVSLSHLRLPRDFLLPLCSFELMSL